MRGLDPRTGIAPGRPVLASAMVCLPGHEKFGTQEGLIVRLPHAGSAAATARVRANQCGNGVKEEIHA
jgi:hypothetical protein